MDSASLIFSICTPDLYPLACFFLFASPKKPSFPGLFIIRSTPQARPSAPPPPAPGRQVSRHFPAWPCRRPRCGQWRNPGFFVAWLCPQFVFFTLHLYLKSCFTPKLENGLFGNFIFRPARHNALKSAKPAPAVHF